VTIEERIQTFRTDLPVRSVDELVRRHITFGDCFALTQDAYFGLKQEVALRFNINPIQVVVVGSAKLGFSIAPNKRYRHFGEQSDIDVALCSSELFDRIWLDAFNYWKTGQFWGEAAQFRKYLFRGWMRPDKLPPARSFQHSHEWWDFFRSLTSRGSFGPYKISGALYKTWHFLESYQAKCVNDCQDLEMAE
jgi:hypothetical protein